MSFDEIFDLTAGVYFFFCNIVTTIVEDGYSVCIANHKNGSCTENHITSSYEIQCKYETHRLHPVLYNRSPLRVKNTTQSTFIWRYVRP